jgi:UDP-N-acetylglucosamine 1-carboxyvinyltransferase
MPFIIHGGERLQGGIYLSGAKNAATKMMIASLLTEEPCILRNYPAIGDVAITEELCRSLGTDMLRRGNVLELHTPTIERTKVPLLSRRNRVPILALGPLLARVGAAEIPLVGGDQIGPRPVNFHLTALRSMGAVIKKGENSYTAEAKGGLHGARIRFDYPSVGATENVILAATLAKGRTFIENAAMEPELIDLVKMLQNMGAIIELGANRTIYIDGVRTLHGVAHEIIPDRNEAVSFACLAVASGGSVFVRGALQEHLITFLNALRRIGGDYEVLEGGIRFWRPNSLRGLCLETDTHPGFMTDWQQPFTVLLTQAEGISKVHETVYEDRFGYVEDLNSMGAKIRVSEECLGELPCRFTGKQFPHSITLSGPTPLHARSLQVRDLRAGIAHIIAALVAKGESVIEGIEEIDRGYERIDERLRELGADIRRV